MMCKVTSKHHKLNYVMKLTAPYHSHSILTLSLLAKLDFFSSDQIDATKPPER